MPVRNLTQLAAFCVPRVRIDLCLLHAVVIHQVFSCLFDGAALNRMYLRLVAIVLPSRHLEQRLSNTLASSYLTVEDGNSHYKDAFLHPSRVGLRRGSCNV